MKRTRPRKLNPFASLSYSYPRERRFSNRFNGGAWNNWFDEFHEYFEKHQMLWSEISELKHCYGFYFADTVKGINEHNEDGYIEQMYETDPALAFAFSARLAEARHQLKEYIGYKPKEALYLETDVDTMVFTKDPLPEAILMKLVCGLNYTKFEFDLYEYVYVD